MTTPNPGIARIRGSFRSPTNLTELAEAVADAGDNALLIAGGQSLLPKLKASSLERDLPREFSDATCLIDVTRVSEMRGISITPDHVDIGGSTSFSEFLESDASAALPAICQALRGVGNTTIRNRATIGGSLAWADPRAQLAVSLLIHDAHVRTTRRELGIGELIRGPFRTALLAGEVILGVRVRHTDGAQRGFAQLQDRNATGRAIVSAALAQNIVDGEEMLEVAIGGLADRPVKSPVPSLGERPSPESRARMAADWLDLVGSTECLLDDPFHSDRYRREMAAVLIRRLLRESGR